MEREVATPPGASFPEAEAPPRRAHGVLAFFKELPVLVALALGIALVIKAFLVQAFYIPSASMRPTLKEGDRVLVNKVSYRLHAPRRGDVVVFKDPYGETVCPKETPAGFAPPPQCNRSAIGKARDWFAELFGLPSSQHRDFIKRIIGLPGETIEIREGDVYINGDKLDLPTTAEDGPQKDASVMAPVTIPEGHFWVMGDNRANSSDSRVFKAIAREKIIGKAFVVLWPPNRFKGL